MKRKNKINGSILGDSDEVSGQTIEPDEQEAGKRGLLAVLGRGERIAAIAVGLLLVVGALGASGIGGRIIQTFKPNAQTQDQTTVSDSQTGNSIFSKLNPFAYSAAAALVATPTPTPQLSKEYIYAGSRMLAVEDAGANAVPPADLGVWRPTDGTWYILNPSNQIYVMPFGDQSTDLPLQGDFDGDGKTDFCVYRLTSGNGIWYVMPSTGGFTQTTFGASGDIPVPADYDGDGRTDLAVYRPSTGVWYWIRSSDNVFTQVQFGQYVERDIPVPKDFDGDGRAELAIYRPTNSNWYILNPITNQFTQVPFGNVNDIPVPADYDGDGRADYAVRENADWLIKQSSNNQTLRINNWQQADDKAVPNDYDGDGKVDVAVWRSSDGIWSIRQSSKVGQSDELRQTQWGQTGDIPVPAFYRR